MTVNALSPDAYRVLRKRVGSQAKVADILGVDLTTISRRERGIVAITREASIALVAVARELTPAPAETVQ